MIEFKNYLNLLLFLSVIIKLNGQIAMANHFPTMKPFYVLDEKNLKDDIAFAYSLRLLTAEYNGPLIQLTKEEPVSSGTYITKDFFAGDKGNIDTEAITTWASTSAITVSILYDQSGNNRNATQTNEDRQPALVISGTRTYWEGDGSNDILIVDDTFNELIENGRNGTILAFIYSTDDRDIAFGAEGPTGSDGNRDAWHGHTNYNNRAYFDPGYCCNSGGNRYYTNLPFIWSQYTFIRRDDPLDTSNDESIGRRNGSEELDGTIANARYLEATDYPMGIGGVVRDNTASTSNRHTNNRFTEFIMYLSLIHI